MRPRQWLLSLSPRVRLPLGIAFAASYLVLISLIQARAISGGPQLSVWLDACLLGTILTGVLFDTLIAVAQLMASIVLTAYYQIPPYHTFRIGSRDDLFRLVSYTVTSVLLIALIQMVRRAERRLHDERGTLRAVIDLAPDGILVCSPARTILEINETACRMAGYRRGDLVGRSDEMLLHPESVADRSAMWDRLRATGGADRSDWPMIRKDGRTQRVEVSSRVLPDGRLIAILRDASARQQLEQAERMQAIGRLAAGIAHRFNNLLAVVMGHASVIAEFETSEPKVSAGREILKASESAAQLVAQLQSFAGVQSRDRRRFSLATIVEECAVGIGRNAPPGVHLSVEIDATLPPVMGDPVQVRQAVSAMAANAIESIEGTGTVWIRTRREHVDGEPFERGGLAAGDYECIEVEDTGSGIDSDNLARVFDPFFTTKFTGRGLGLAAVKGIATMHAGGVRAESAPGKGSKFQLLLPLS